MHRGELFEKVPANDTPAIHIRHIPSVNTRLTQTSQHHPAGWKPTHHTRTSTTKDTFTMTNEDILNALIHPAEDSKTAKALAEFPPNTAEAVITQARTTLMEATND